MERRRPFDKARFTVACERAFDLCCDFHKKQGRTPYDIIRIETANGTWTAGVDAESFGHFVVFDRHEEMWGSGEYLQPKLARYHVLFQCLRMSSLEVQSLGGFPSWLYRIQPGVYACVFDDRVLSDAAQTKNPYARGVKSLYLHELGHCALEHDQAASGADKCRSGKLGLGSSTQKKTGRGQVPKPVAASTEQMEQEAWVFAGTVLSLGVANRAFSRRLAGQPDDAWNLTL